MNRVKDVHDRQLKRWLKIYAGLLEHCRNYPDVPMGRVVMSAKRKIYAAKALAWRNLN